MKTKAAFYWLVAALALLSWASWGGPALAAGPESTRVELLLPPDLAVGQEMKLAARVTTASGSPVPGVEVVFVRAASFMNTEGEVLLGKAIADSNGIALLSSFPRSEGEVTFVARFAGNEQLQRSSASVEAAVRAGPPAYGEEVGVRIPGLSVAWLVGLLSAVWAVYFTVMGLLFLIAREGGTGPQPGEA
ncbi:MAG: hypothetical protein HYX99_00980 [Chloroflexi bacterium]|nr:hypothetical protein [Chloroflexota bacterium]